ncbi:MAG TPA: ISL3 family transposase [Rhabdochlamydiaceae bacterium]|nr:ISL3 family transposase [Rhabdochlamydiaceae bacterium]
MSTSLLYHTNRINGVKYKATRYEGGAVIWEVELQKGIQRCPKCSDYHHNFKERKTRKICTVPIGAKPCFIEVHTHRLECKKCKYRWWPKFSFIAGQRRMTKIFADYLVSMMKLGTIKAVSEFTGTSWDTVKDIHKQHLEKKYRSVEYGKLQYLGIDEFSIKKGHEYMTVVVDLETGRIVHAVEGRSKESIMPFLRKLARRATNLIAMAMDMSGPYESAVREVLPKIDVVFDRYHVMALCSKAIDEIRREQQNRCNAAGLKALKGQRFLLLKNFEKLGTTEKSSLEALLEVNKPLAVAHTMKEQLRLFWIKSNSQEAASCLGWWIIEAMESGIKELWRLARTLIDHFRGLLTYFKHEPIQLKC